jgi:O-antigen/teichoic acid export membrane protein
VRLKRGTLRHDAILLLGGGFFVRLCGLLFVIVLARALPERQIGLFSFAEAVADMLIVIASFNLDSLIVRRIAGGAPTEVTQRFAPLLGFRLFSAPVYLLVICLVAVFSHTEQRWILPVVGVYTLAESLYFCLSDMFVGIGKPAVRAAVEVIAELIFTLAFVLGMWFRPTMGTLIEASVLRGCLLVGVVLYLIRTRLGRLRVAWDNSLIVAGIPFLLMASLTILQGKLETVLLGVLSNYETVGVFQLALRLILAAQFIPQAVVSAVYPRFCATGLSAQNYRRLFVGVAALLGLGLLGSVSILVLNGPVTRLLYGPAAQQVAPVLSSMAPLLPVRFVALFVAAVLTAVGRERAVLVSMIAATIVGAGTDLLLIPRLGAVGASIGLFASALCQFLYFGMLLARDHFAVVDPPAPASHADLPERTPAALNSTPSMSH